MSTTSMHILLIGPRLDAKRNNVGGATRSFEYLVDYLEGQQVVHRVINTQKFGSTAANFAFCLVDLLRFIWGSNLVFLNTSQKGIVFLGPIVFVLSRLLGKKVVVRPFGGALKEQYETAGGLRKWLFRATILQADIVYLQTKALIQFFQPLSGRVKQFSTSRKAPDNQFLRGDRPFQKRFLFLGHVKKTKGIGELIEAKKQLDDSYTIDVFGPIVEPVYDDLSQAPFYKGVLTNEQQVLRTLQQYDVVVLPTYYPGEGYPGTLIEAYSLGLPVIATQWKSIPEIVESEKTGILVAPQSVEALVQGIQSFNAGNYPEMSRHALQCFKAQFEVSNVMEKAMRELQELVQ